MGSNSKHYHSFLLSFFILIFCSSSYGMDQRGRLGVGVTQQLKNDLPAISFKLQKSESFAMGGVLGISTSDEKGGYGAGLKFYRIMFDEPQLNFYSSVMGAMIKKQTTSKEESGFQFDFTLGSEFSFTGLPSLGFSFEFGVSLNKLNDFVVETVGYQFVVAAVHFYL